MPVGRLFNVQSNVRLGILGIRLPTYGSRVTFEVHIGPPKYIYGALRRVEKRY